MKLDELLKWVTLFGIMFGGVRWLTSIYEQGLANAAEIEDLNKSLVYRIERIENKIDYLIERLPKKSKEEF